jgi:hypothetical protein
LGQIRRFRRPVPLLHPAPERFDHGEQHSQDASQQERDSRRQVPVSAEVAGGEPGTGGAAGFGNTGISAGYAAFPQTFQPGDPP